MDRKIRLERQIRLSEKWITKMTAYILKINLRLQGEKAFLKTLEKELKQREKEMKKCKKN